MKYVYEKRNKVFRHCVRFEAEVYNSWRHIVSGPPIYRKEVTVRNLFLEETVGKVNKEWTYKQTTYYSNEKNQLNASRRKNGKRNLYPCSYSFKTEEAAMWFILRFGNDLCVT